MVQKKDAAPFRNRKSDISQNVLDACNFDLEFIYVLSGWKSSAHDSKILNDALIDYQFQKVHIYKYIF